MTNKPRIHQKSQTDFASIKNHKQTSHPSKIINKPRIHQKSQTNLASIKITNKPRIHQQYHGTNFTHSFCLTGLDNWSSRVLSDKSADHKDVVSELLFVFRATARHQFFEGEFQFTVSAENKSKHQAWEQTRTVHDALQSVFDHSTITVKVRANAFKNFCEHSREPLPW